MLRGVLFFSGRLYKFSSQKINHFVMFHMPGNEWGD